MKAIVDSLDNVPEAIRGEYAEKDGKFVLKLEDAEEVYAGPLKRAHLATKEEKRKALEQLKEFDGIDAAKAREVLAQYESKAAEEARIRGDWEAREKQLIEKNQAEISKLHAAIAAKDAMISRSLIDSEVITAIKNMGAFPQAEEAILPVVRALSKVVVSDKGEYTAQVLDRPGGAERFADGVGTKITIAQLVAELAEREPWNHLFPAQSVAGSGAPAANAAGGANGRTAKSRDRMTVPEKSAFIDKHGYDAYIKLPAKS